MPRAAPIMMKMDSTLSPGSCWNSGDPAAANAGAAATRQEQNQSCQL